MQELPIGASDDDVVISLRGVGKCYYTYDSQRARMRHALFRNSKAGIEEIWALRDISFEVRRGQSVGIIGRNGSGKSTLLEIITGTLTPTTGSVSVKGRIAALLELGSGFNPAYTGRENVFLNGLILGLSREDIANRFDEIVAFADIGDVLDRPVKTYSSGMLVRLAFAVQAVIEPDILIVDEALSVGDFFFQQKCLARIRLLQSIGTTVLFVSHDLQTVRDLCQKGLYLRNGQLSYCGDNVVAIDKFMSDGTLHLVSPVTMDHNNTTALFHKNNSIRNPSWLASTEVKSTETVAQLLAVGVYNDIGDAANSIPLGAVAEFRILYRFNTSVPVHLTLSIKNRYDQIITSVGSYTLNLDPPRTTHLGGMVNCVFHVRVGMKIEAGLYTYKVSAGAASSSAVGVGATLDETPWLGPFQIVFDYEREKPPFYGMHGLYTSGHFLVLPYEPGGA